MATPKVAADAVKNIATAANTARNDVRKGDFDKAYSDMHPEGPTASSHPVSSSGKPITVRGGSGEDHNPGNPWPKKAFAVSKSYDVYGGHMGEATSGVHSTQPEGRKALPPVDNNVGEAKAVPGATLRAVRKQVGDNRYAINSHVAEKKEFGPNN
jgi:hypothetical protein